MKIMSDDVFAEIQAQIAWMRKEAEQHLRTISALTEQIVEMKRDGFARPTTQMIQQTGVPSVDDRVMAAIRSVAAEGSALERDLLTYAQSQITLGEEIEDIADAILAGSPIGSE